VTELARRSGVRGAIWEVGAGNGAVAVHLQRSGFEVVAVEPSMAGARTAFERDIETVIAGTLEDIRLPTSSIAAVGLFDVLEHLPAPGEILAEVARVLTPGGALLVTVPASSRLWSHADVVAGHFRRYTRRSLNAEVLGHGFQSRHSQYLFHSLVLAVFVARVLRSTTDGEGADRNHDVDALVAQLRPRRGPLGYLASGVLAFERALDRIRPLPFGTSVLAAYTRIG
jgi:SAM-dependent methyltransferase